VFLPKPYWAGTYNNFLLLLVRYFLINGCIKKPQIMKNDLWALEKIETEFPELHLDKSSDVKKTFRAFDTISDYALKLLNNDDHGRLEKFFKLIDGIRKRCSTITKIAIDNIFIYRISTHIECASCRKKLIDMMPESMRSIMLHNFHAPAI